MAREQMLGSIVPDFIYVLVTKGSGGYASRKQYWPRKDGSMPGSLVEVIAFWSQNPAVTVKVYKYTMDEEVPL